MIDEEKIKESDGHWTEVMKLAEEYGFILQAYGGTATLATHENKIKFMGEEKYMDHIKVMFGIESPSRLGGNYES